MTQWIDGYVGQEWVLRDHDCWGFFRKVQREQFGIEVPEMDVDSASPLQTRHAFKEATERARWVPVESPRHGDGVLMGKNPRPSHVGVFVETPAPAVLHCVENIGVLVQSLSSLKAMGWTVCGFYRHVDRA
jgi:hypothetical protein